MNELILKYKRDILILVIAFLIGLTGLLLMDLLKTSGNYVQVMIDGTFFGEYSLYENQEIDLYGFNQGTNHLIIQDGNALVTSASCPDRICCMKHPISKNGESIVCLPNKVVIKVVSNSEGAYDGISQ